MNGDQPFGDLAAGRARSAEQILGFRRGGGAGRGRCHALDARGLPDLEEQHRDEQRDERRGDVDQARSRRSSTRRTACRRTSAPATSSAGSTSKVPFQPVIVRTSQIGRISENGGRIRPAIADSSNSGSPVTPASVRIGLPTPPHATGAVLAIRQRTAASNGLKPRPIRKAPAIATGAPPPPVPSRKAPKQKAMSTAWIRRSDDSRAIESLHHLRTARSPRRRGRGRSTRR